MVKENGVLRALDLTSGQGMIYVPGLGSEFRFSWSQVRLLDESGNPQGKELPSLRRVPPRDTEVVAYLKGKGKELIVEFVVYKKHHDAILGLIHENEHNREDEDFLLRQVAVVA